MKTRAIISSGILCGIALLFSFSYSNAQVHVATDGDVGVGATSPLAKLHVAMNSATSNYTAYFHNPIGGTGIKNGLYNYVTSAGTGTRYGIRNYTYSSNTANNASLGLYNRTLGSIGTTYGQYVYTQQPAGATGLGRGIYNYLNTATSGVAYGLHNYVYSASGNGTRYGIYTRAHNNGSGTVYGLYSTITGTGTGTQYAGYFNGNVHINGNLTYTSDARKKENIRGISNALGVLASLQPKTYTFVEDKNMNLPAGEQFGFLAQELEVTLPSLVSTIEQPANVEPANGPDEDGELRTIEAQEEPELAEEFKSINYTALIPILVQAVNDQQAQIEAQKAEIEALKKQIGNK